jgi:putative phage-type endonuclease
MSAAQQIQGRAYEVIGSGTADRDAWLKMRTLGIGASEISVVLGVSGWTSILSLYYSKIDHAVLDEDDPEEYQLWGNLLQDAILGELTKRAGVTIRETEPHLRSTVHPWALATPDALTTDGEPVEAKNIAWGYDADEWEQGIPEPYYLQCQQQCLVTGAERCLFGALLWGSKLVWEWVPRDEQAIARIVTAGSAFWRNVQTRTEPRSDGHPEARRILGRLATDEASVEMYEDEISDDLVGWRTAEHDLKRIRTEERVSKKQRDACADRIAQAMGRHRKAFTVTGWAFQWQTVDRKGFTVEPVTFQQLKIKAPK